jgi:hypothetical protein
MSYNLIHQWETFDQQKDIETPCPRCKRVQTLEAQPRGRISDTPSKGPMKILRDGNSPRDVKWVKWVKWVKSSHSSLARRSLGSFGLLTICCRSGGVFIQSPESRYVQVAVPPFEDSEVPESAKRVQQNRKGCSLWFVR